jgi:hypothetical protein
MAALVEWSAYAHAQNAMFAASSPVRTPGSLAVAIVVGLMFATPLLAALRLGHAGFQWSALVDFVGAHRFGLILGFGLMIAISLLLRAARSTVHPAAEPESSAIPDAVRDLDGLA